MSHKVTPLKKSTAPSPAAQPATPQASTFDALPDTGFVREAQLVSSPKRPGVPVLLPFSAPTLWRKVKTKTFPAPVKLSSRVTCWKVGDVRAWLAAQEAQTYAPAAKLSKRTALVMA